MQRAARKFEHHYFLESAYLPRTLLLDLLEFILSVANKQVSSRTHRIDDHDTVLMMMTISGQ